MIKTPSSMRVKADKPLWAMLLFTLLLAVSAHQILFVDHAEEFSRTALGDFTDEVQEAEPLDDNRTLSKIDTGIFASLEPLLVVLFILAFISGSVHISNKASKSSPRAPPATH